MLVWFFSPFAKPKVVFFKLFKLCKKFPVDGDFLLEEEIL